MVRKDYARKTSKKKASEPSSSSVLDVSITRNQTPQNTLDQKILNFKTQVGTSKYAKMLNISGTKVDHVVNKMKASDSLCASVDGLSISGCKKPYVQVGGSS